MSTCGNRIQLVADVVAATYAPYYDQPRELVCEREVHPHDGPHYAEGWEWENGRVWLIETLRPAEHDTTETRGVKDR